MNIKPIQTSYKGYLFRSRLEARWAVFFDTLGIKWEYEKEGYDLGEEGWYLPDFWLPEEKIWVEIKGQSPTEKEKKKAEALFYHTSNPVILLSGALGDHLLECFIQEMADNGGGYKQEQGKFYFYGHGQAPGLWVGICRGRQEPVEYLDGDCNYDVRFFDSSHDFNHPSDEDAHTYSAAIAAARSARFEHK